MNLGKRPFRIEPNDRIAQLVFCQYTQADLVLVDVLPETIRNKSGFGESGSK